MRRGCERPITDEEVTEIYKRLIPSWPEIPNKGALAIYIRDEIEIFRRQDEGAAADERRAGRRAEAESDGKIA